MPDATAFPDRIRRLVESAESQRALARIIGVSDGTIVGWMGGQEPYQSTLAKIAERTGVSLAWLRDGVGETAAEVARFTARLAGNSHGAGLTAEPESSVIREDSPDMRCPFTSDEAIPRGMARVIETMAARQTSAELATTISDVLRDPTTPAAERHALAERLNLLLARKLAAERGDRNRKN